MAMFLRQRSGLLMPAGPVWLNRASPLARGLAYAQLDPRTSRDALNGSFPTVIGTVKRPGRIGLVRGYGATYGVGASDRIETTLTAHAALRTYAIWAWFVTDLGGRLFDKRTGGAEVELLYTFPAPNTNILYTRVFSSGSSQWSTPRPSDEDWHLITLSYDAGSSSNVPVMYVDGVARTVTTDLSPSGTPNNNNNPYVVGNRGGADRVFNGMLGPFLVWNRILTPAEVFDLWHPSSRWDLWGLPPQGRRLFALAPLAADVTFWTPSYPPHLPHPRLRTSGMTPPCTEGPETLVG